MESLDKLVEKIKFYINNEELEELEDSSLIMSAIIYEMASGDKDKYNAIVAILEGDATIVDPNLN